MANVVESPLVKVKSLVPLLKDAVTTDEPVISLI